MYSKNLGIYSKNLGMYSKNLGIYSKNLGMYSKNLRMGLCYGSLLWVFGMDFCYGSLLWAYNMIQNNSIHIFLVITRNAVSRLVRPKRMFSKR